MFLTPEEVELLTGYVNRNKQSEWMEKNNIPHLKAQGGRSIVLRKEIERILSREDASKDEPEIELDFSYMNSLYK